MRVLPLLSAAVLLAAPNALADPPLDSVARGAIIDTSLGTSAVGDTLMAELGGESAGIRSLREGAWLLQWDVLVAAKAGYHASQEPYFFLLGAHALAWAEGGARFLPSRAWSPYAGVRLANETQIMGHAGLSLSDLRTVNAEDGVGGVNNRALVRLDGGASLLDARHSLLLVGFVQEVFRAPTFNFAGQAFTELGLQVRYDLSRSLMASVEGVWGVTVKRTLPPGLTDQTTHAGVWVTFRKIFKNGMWFGAAVSLERDTNHVVYDTGTVFDTASAPTFAFALTYGLSLWRPRP